MNFLILPGDERNIHVRPSPMIPLFAELLAASRAGDPEAFCTLITEHEVHLLGQACALCRNDHGLAEDLAQETLVEAWRSLGRYDEARCRLATWLWFRPRRFRPGPLRPLDCLSRQRRLGK